MRYLLQVGSKVVLIILAMDFFCCSGWHIAGNEHRTQVCDGVRLLSVCVPFSWLGESCCRVGIWSTFYSIPECWGDTRWPHCAYWSQAKWRANQWLCEKVGFHGCRGWLALPQEPILASQPGDTAYMYHISLNSHCKFNTVFDKFRCALRHCDWTVKHWPTPTQIIMHGVGNIQEQGLSNNQYRTNSRAGNAWAELGWFISIQTQCRFHISLGYICM